MFTLLFLAIDFAVLLMLGSGPWAPPYNAWTFGRGILFILIVVLTILWLVQGGSPVVLPVRH